MNVNVSINSSSSILVKWLPPVGGADEYVILYSASNMTHLIEQRTTLTMSLLKSLNKGHLYTIRVFAYKDLPSMPFGGANIYFAGTYIVLYMLIASLCPHYQFLLSSQFSFQCH